MGPEVSGEGGGRQMGKKARVCRDGSGMPMLGFRVIQCAREKELSRPPSGSRFGDSHVRSCSTTICGYFRVYWGDLDISSRVKCHWRMSIQTLSCIHVLKMPCDVLEAIKTH